MQLHPYISYLLGHSSPEDSAQLEKFQKMSSNKTKEHIPDMNTEDWLVQGSGTDIPVRIYSPDIIGASPALIFLHGGGFCDGSIETHDLICRKIALYSGWKVISVEYRLAPANKFPAGLNDAFDAAQWVFSNRERLSIIENQIAIGGDSAGANLATVICIKAHKYGKMRFCKQVLIYPTTDAATEGYESCDLFKKGYLYTKQSIKMTYDAYLNPDEDRANPYVSPIKAADLSGLPPALVVTAEFDPLRDQGEKYAQRLSEFGVPVKLKRIEGVTHAFLSLFPEIDEFDSTIKLIGSFLGDKSQYSD
jgi:acetyl esterase